MHSFLPTQWYPYDQPVQLKHIQTICWCCWAIGMGSVLCSQLNKMLFERHVLPSTIFKETVDLRLLVGYKFFSFCTHTLIIFFRQLIAIITIVWPAMYHEQSKIYSFFTCAWDLMYCLWTAASNCLHTVKIDDLLLSVGVPSLRTTTVFSSQCVPVSVIWITSAKWKQNPQKSSCSTLTTRWELLVFSCLFWWKYRTKYATCPGTYCTAQFSQGQD